MTDKNGFTLAEVLITLGIIGIVAQITIPALVNSSRNTQYVTTLKKAYSEFNQVLLQIQTDGNSIGDLRGTGIFDEGTDSQTLGSEIVKYFKVSKNCDTNQKGCFPAIAYMGLNKQYSFPYDDQTMGNYKFITAGGISFMIYNFGGGCPQGSSYWDNDLGEVVSDPSTPRACAGVNVDINGPKLPNIYGRDLFDFYINPITGSLYPYGGSDKNMSPDYWADGTCGNSDPPVGGSCAGRILDEGWKMNY